MHDHLQSLGFKPMLGDPCFFKKMLPDGSFILVATYIDDITYGVTSQETADQFLLDVRKRFVIEEGEGKPISWLLNMKVTQDLEAGTISLDQEVAITKLAHTVLSPEKIAKASSVHYPMIETPLEKLATRLVSKEEFDSRELRSMRYCLRSWCPNTSLCLPWSGSCSRHQTSDYVSIQHQDTGYHLHTARPE